MNHKELLIGIGISVMCIFVTLAWRDLNPPIEPPAAPVVTHAPKPEMIMFANPAMDDEYQRMKAKDVPSLGGKKVSTCIPGQSPYCGAMTGTPLEHELQLQEIGYQGDGE